MAKQNGSNDLGVTISLQTAHASSVRTMIFDEDVLKQLLKAKLLWRLRGQNGPLPTYKTLTVQIHHQKKKNKKTTYARQKIKPRRDRAKTYCLAEWIIGKHAPFPTLWIHKNGNLLDWRISNLYPEVDVKSRDAVRAAVAQDLVEYKRCAMRRAKASKAKTRKAKASKAKTRKAKAEQKKQQQQEPIAVRGVEKIFNKHLLIGDRFHEYSPVLEEKVEQLEKAATRLQELQSGWSSFVEKWIEQINQSQERRNLNEMSLMAQVNEIVCKVSSQLKRIELYSERASCSSTMAADALRENPMRQSVQSDPPLLPDQAPTVAT